MKKTAFFIIAALAAVSAASADDFSVMFTPAGNVSSYTKTIYSVTSKFGDYFRTVSEKENHIFKNGLETENSVSNAKDELVTKFVYSYDGKKVKDMTYTDIASSAELKYEYEYDAASKLKSQSVTETESGNLDSKIVYKYEPGKCTENYYDKDGKLFMRINQTLTEDESLPSEEIQYNGDGTFALMRKYSYTDAKKNASIETYDESGVCTKKVVFRYDTNNFLTEIQIYTDGKISERRIYKNDALGNPTRISYYDVAEKFGTTVNELTRIDDFTYTY